MASQRLQIPIDKFGRVVLPKEIRVRLGVSPGTEFEIEEREDAILLKPVPRKAKMVKKGGWYVIQSSKPLPENIIEETLNKVRMERIRRCW